MAAYTGTTQVKPGLGKIWLAVLAFAVAAALVIALVAMQGGSPAPSSPGTAQTQSHLNGVPTTGGSGTPQAIAHHLICSRCAP
jgi:ABC-type phosphate transport system substrate-binding protein